MAKVGEVLILSRSDIESVLSPADALEMCDKTFKWINEGKTRQIHSGPLVINLGSGIRNIFMPYPGYISSLGVASIKWLSAYTTNPAKELPYSMAMDILNDAETGAPIAVMEGMFVTSMRTAGHSAVGAKYLARKDSEVITILGCGREGRAQLRLMNELFKIKEVRVCDVIIAVRDKFCAEIREMFGLNVRPYDTIEEAVRGADVVCEVTTSREPTVKAEWVEPGCYLASPNVHGLEPKLTRKADKWVVGNWERDLQWIEPDPAYSKNDIYASLDELAAGKKVGRETDREITMMTHHGMAVLDTSVMYLVYNRAVEKGIGTLVNLF
jgi:ornithine cyclodeaminase/alanine dehydrogenase-like protein (mu-crystallin family)